MEAANPWCQPTFSHNNFNAPKANWGGLTLSSQGGGSMPGSVPQMQRTSPYKQAQQNHQQKPADNVVTAPNDSPFPHVVGIQGLPDNCLNSTIKEFFKPAKAIAINVLGNGFCDIAFKTHDDALQAMSKDRMNLDGKSINLTLKSQAPSGWGDL